MIVTFHSWLIWPCIDRGLLRWSKIHQFCAQGLHLLPIIFSDLETRIKIDQRHHLFANCNGTTLASQPIDDDRDLFSLPLSLWWNQWIVALWSLFTRNLNLPASEFDNRANWHSDQFTIFNNQPGQLVTTIDINEISNYRVDGHWPARTQIKRLPKTKSLVKET